MMPGKQWRLVSKDMDVLRTKTHDIVAVGPDLLHVYGSLIHDMFVEMEKHGGIGLAAPQVGENLSIFIVHPHLVDIDGIAMLGRSVFINPKIIEKSVFSSFCEEGCLSLPKETFKVRRANGISVEAISLRGEKFRVCAEGLLAYAIQHEHDHLNGILIDSDRNNIHG